MRSTPSSKLAVLTGASSRIGLELAKNFARNASTCWSPPRTRASRRCPRNSRRSGAEVDAVRVDLARSEGVEQLYQAVAALGRPLDALALNAGIGAGGAFTNGAQQ